MLPKLTLKIAETSLGQLYEGLRFGRLDVALLFDPPRRRRLEAVPLWAEALYLVGGRDSPIAATDFISLEELASHRLILPGPGDGVRAVLEAFTAPAGVDLRTTLETDRMAIQKDMAMRGLGYAVLPFGAIQSDIRRGRLSTAPIAPPTVKRRLLLAYPDDRSVSSATRIVGQHVIDVAHQMITAGSWPGLLPDYSTIRLVRSHPSDDIERTPHSPEPQA